jgi:hypothetical protein
MVCSGAPTRRIHDSPDEWPIDSSAKNTGMRLTAGVFFCFVPQATAGGRAGLFVDIDPIPPNTNLGEGPHPGTRTLPERTIPNLRRLSANRCRTARLVVGRAR